MAARRPGACRGAGWHEADAKPAAPSRGQAADACRAPRLAGTLVMTAWASYLVRCLIFRDDRGRNTAPLAHLVTALPRPRPDLRAVLAAGTRACLAAPATTGGTDP